MKAIALSIAFILIILFVVGAFSYVDSFSKVYKSSNPIPLEFSSSPIVTSLKKLDKPQATVQVHTFALIQKHPAIKLAECVNKNNLDSHMYTLAKTIGSRQIGSKGNTSTRKYIVGELQKLGFSESKKTLIKQPFYAYDMYTENIVAIIPSATVNSPIIVIGAHFDSVSVSSGAVDNASGVSSLLELTRIICEEKERLEIKFEIRICFFSAEENGYLGAKKYLNSLDNETLNRHYAFMNIDMSAYSTFDTNKLLTVSTKAEPNGSDPAKTNLISNSLERAYLILKMDPSLLECPSGVGKHDIVPFFNLSISSATVSWREYDSGSNSQNSAIHPPSVVHTYADKYENTDINSLFTTTQLLAATFSLVADAVNLQM